MITSNPLPGLQFGFLFRQPYTMTSKFNEARDYSRFYGRTDDRHEGCDYDVLESGVADSKAHVLAPFPGIVIEAGVRRAPGNFVKVESLYIWDLDTDAPQSRVFVLTFAHLDKTFVTAGTPIEIGDELGEIGNSGNSFGEHLHLTLQVPGFGRGGYVYPDVCDPDQYFPGHPHLSYVVIVPR